MKQINKTITSTLIAAATCMVGVSAINTLPDLNVRDSYSAPESAGVEDSDANLNEGEVYAYLGGGNFGKTMGMYKLSQDGGYTHLWTEGLLDKSFVMQCGWLRDGVLCGFAQFGVGNWILGYAYEEIDITSGEAVSDPRLIDLDDNYLSYYQIAAYNPDNDRIYGYGYVETAGDKSVFKSSPGSEPEKATVVKTDYVPAEACLGLCYNDEKGTLAGINLNHEFVYVDLDGNQTPVMELGIEGLQNIVSAMAWSPADGYYLFNAILADGGSELYALDPDEQTVTLLSPISDNLTFAYMLSPEGQVKENAPMVPTITRLTFEDGENDGMLVFNMPSTNGKGEAFDSNLGYQIWVDGKLWENSFQAPGEMVCVSFRDLADGDHVFRVAATYEGLMSPKATIRQYVGNDTPEAPANVRMSFNKVVWDAVTEGTHKGYLNLADLTYDVYINDEWVDSTTETCLEIELPEGEITPYKCYVYASCSGKESVPGVSNTIVYGDPLELDVYIEPTEEQAEIVTVLDANADESTWHPRNYQGSIVFSYYANAENSGDDWLFMPGIEFGDAEALYDITFESSYHNTVKPEEYFEIWLCAAPDIESERHCILGKTRPVSNRFETTSVGFSVPSEGVWYVAFRAVSDPDQMYLNIRNISISQTAATLHGPEKVTPVGFKDVSKGDRYMSEVTFDMPEYLLNGEAIDASAEITAVVKGVTETTVTGKPGARKSAVVEVEEGFSNVTISTEIGDDKGAETFMKVYAGPDMPGRINGLKAEVAADNRSVTLSWEAPETGANGGSVDASEIKYRLMLFTGKIWKYPPVTIEGTTCTYTPEDTETLQNYPFSIDAYNDKGDNDDDQPVVIVQLGQPLSLPVAEGFSDSQVNVAPLAGYAVGDFAGTSWGVADPATYGDQYSLDGDAAMVGSASVDDATGRLMFPKFSTLDVTDYVGVKMIVWTGEGSADMTLYAQCSGSDDVVEIHSFTKGSGWEEVELTLPEDMAGRDWVQLWLDATYPDTDAHTLLGEYMFYMTDKQVGVDVLNAAATFVRVSEGYIEILASEESHVNVWTLDGICIASCDTDYPVTRIELPKGFYIVKVNDNMVKVNVK